MNEKELEPKITPTFTVTLTVMDWHRVLKELEFCTSICNRDTENVTDLWEQIATQLAGKEQIIHGSSKHRKICPQDFIKKEEPKPDVEDNRTTQKLNPIRKKFLGIF